MFRKFSISLFIIVVVIIPGMAYAILMWYQLMYQDLPVMETGQTISFRMQNQEGKWITAEDWRGKIVVVDFFFSHCPVICPKMTNNLKIVQRSFPEENMLSINSFSVDPERDSVPRLKEFASRFNIPDEWNLLTGDKREIYRLARKGFQLVATEGDGGENDFIHSDRLVLLDDKMRIRGFYDGSDEKEMVKLIEGIRRLRKSIK